MRLIDADALEELFREVIGDIAQKPEMNGNLEHMVRASAMVIEMIKDAPTIEERKIGRWIYDGYDHPHGIEWCHCSVCGNRDSVDSVYTQVDVYPYCAKCGSRMMEVEHG